MITGKKETQQYLIQLNSINDIKQLVSIIDGIPEFSAIIVSGNKYAVNAASLMGLFTLDLTKPNILLLTGSDKTINETVKKLSDFIIN